MSGTAALVASRGDVLGRPLLAPAGVRLDLLVHALAQLPEHVTLAVPHPGHERARIETLATAYGVADRVRFGAADGMPVDPALLAPPHTFAELLEALCPDGGPASTRNEHADGVLARHRVAVVTNVPMHYRVALFGALAERLDRAGAVLRVFFQSDGDGRTWLSPEQQFGFEHERVRVVRGRGVPVPRDLSSRLRRFGPTVLLVGGFSPFVAGAAARYASRAGIPFGIWSGEIAASATAASSVRRRQRRRLLSRADFAIAYGRAAGEYLHSLAPALPLVYGRNSTPLPEPTPRRARDVVEVLTVGRALPRKGLDYAVDAFTRLADLPCRLTVVGGGPELPALVRRAKDNPAIRFLGPQPADRVRRLYADADVFVFPSREDVFGLVLVEAMGAGVATVVSTAVGAVDDLAVPGANCLVAERDDTDAWTDAIRKLVTEPSLRRSLGERAAATVGNRWTIEHAAEAMTAGLRLALLEATR